MKQTEKIVTPELNATLRFCIPLLMAFMLLNVMRELTYLIGSIQAYGAPLQKDYVGLFRVVISFLMGGMAAGLRNGSQKAWWTVVISGSVLAKTIWGEWEYLKAVKATGTDQADVQIVFLGFAVVFLVLAIGLLLTPEGRKPFFPNGVFAVLRG